MLDPERVKPFLTLNVINFGDFSIVSCPEMNVGSRGRLNEAKSYLHLALEAASYYIINHPKKLSPEDEARLPLARKVMECIKKGIPLNELFSTENHKEAVRMDEVWVIPS